MKSKCPNQECNSTYFESHLEDVHNSKYQVDMIRCKRCKTVVGVLESHDVATLVKALARELKVKI